MISNIKDTLVVSLLMIASLSFVENAIAGPYSGAVYQGEEFLGTYAVSAIVTRCFSTTKINWSFWVGRLTKRSRGAGALFWSQSKTMTGGSLSSVIGVSDGF